MSDKLSLPASSYDQLTKIIRGYSLSSENMGLDELAKLVGISKTRVSANHKLLIELGLITGGNKKSATPLGKNLGHAIEHNQEEAIRSAWQKAIKGNERMSSLITTVSIKGGMSADEWSYPASVESLGLVYRLPQKDKESIKKRDNRTV